MIRYTGQFLGLLFMLLFISCEKEELPKPIIATDGAIYQTLEMGEDYSTHIGFSLQTSAVYQIQSIDWDIYIYPNRAVRMNTSRFMKVVKLEQSEDFNTTIPDSIYEYDDYSNEDFDFKIQLTEEEQYYIIDLGRNIEGEVLKKVDCKLKLIDDELIMQYKYRSENIWKEKVLRLNASSGQFFSFLNEESIESNLFTGSDFYCGGYITRFKDANLDYLVRGILLNTSKNIEIALYPNNDYDEIDLSKVSALQFTKHIDKIGYDWKVYDLEKGLYIIDQSKVFIIRYSNGLIYKLKFIDYYNDEGKKGYPMISFELLE